MRPAYTQYFKKSLLITLLLLPLCAHAAEEDVTWTGLVNATATGNGMQKSQGCHGCADAGGASTQRIEEGNGYVEFSLVDGVNLLYGGLASASLGNNPLRYTHSFRIQAGILEIRELGVYKHDTPASSSDRVRIAIERGVVKYYKNSTLVYWSRLTPSYPLLFKIALLDSESSIGDATIFRTIKPAGMNDTSTQERNIFSEGATPHLSQ